MRHSLDHLPQGASEFCGESWLFQLHCRIRRYRSERTRTVGCRANRRHEEVGHCAWLPQLYGCGYHRMRSHCALAGPKVRQEDNDGLHHHLQSDRWSECGRDPRPRSSRRSSSIWKVRRSVQRVVPLCAAGLCHHNAAHRDHLPERKLPENQLFYTANTS